MGKTIKLRSCSGEKKIMKKYKINLCLGDYDLEGHREEAHFTIWSNLSKKEIQKFFRVGAKTLQCDITKYCSALEDNKIPIQVLNKFIAYGLKLKIDQNSKKKKHEIDIQTFVDCFLLTVKIGNPKFNFEFEKHTNNLYIGGYGLFEF